MPYISQDGAPVHVTFSSETMASLEALLAGPSEEEIMSQEGVMDHEDKKDHRVDTAKQGEFSLFRHNKTWMLSMSTESFWLDSMSTMKSSLKLWAMNRSAEETILIDAFDGVLQGHDNAWSAHQARATIGAFMNTPAKTCFRLNNIVGNMTCLLALACDEIVVGDHGSLFLLPFIKLEGSDMSQMVKPWISHLYRRGMEAGILEEEEYQTLIDRSDTVWLKRETLLERGVKPASAIE